MDIIAIFGCLTIRYDAALPFIVLWFSLTNQILIPKAICIEQGNLWRLILHHKRAL